eukprot:TRINITY_DN8549_c0_g1_i1.p1 TRINITY_DN8549_c0_g1~~TRINITY_DN8549_c0_g1_i1.p1  ORF type:complete len:168 (+),score=30.43 TRINITY_DN8549_c0_g1_i1:46-504(+)
MSADDEVPLITELTGNLVQADVDQSSPKRKAFYLSLVNFMARRGTPIKKFALIGRQQLDMYRLYELVTAKSVGDPHARRARRARPLCRRRRRKGAANALPRCARARCASPLCAVHAGACRVGVRDRRAALRAPDCHCERYRERVVMKQKSTN